MCQIWFSGGSDWYLELVGVANGQLEKRGSRKILAVSRNLGSVYDKSPNLVFAWFVFTFFESRNFLPKSLRLGFLTRISASRRVSDFTIRHPYLFQPSKQTGLFDVILAKRILRAKDKSDRVCSSCGRKMKTLHQLYSFVSSALFSSENWESGRKSDSSAVFQNRLLCSIEFYWIEKFRNMYFNSVAV